MVTLWIKKQVAWGLQFPQFTTLREFLAVAQGKETQA